MRKNVLARIVFPAAMLFTLAFGFSSCGDDVTYFGTDMVTDYFTVEKNAWKWVPSPATDVAGRFECTLDYDKMDGYMIDEGGIQSHVFVNENGNEFLKPLPFIQTYVDRQYDYEETISCDYELGKITFFIQSSDPAIAPGLPGRYVFKITLFWREG